jgi:hypothetical protein
MEETNNTLAGLMAPEQEAAKEILPGMTVEEIRAVYFNANALREPAYRLYQLNSGGYRYYYRFDANGEPEFYPSVTTLLKQVMPTPPGLLDWIAANGKEGAAEKRDLAAAYGTFMHGQFESLIINRRYDFDAVPAVLLDYMSRNNVPESYFNQWIVKIRKDVLAFAQFVRDWNVRPLAVEIGLVHPVHRYAGCLDLPCEMTDPKTLKDFRAIVDFKSGRKGFYEEHELQLHLYREMWNFNYPDDPVERVFNFSPKDWRTKPTYNLKEQTDSVNAAKIPYLLQLAAIEDDKRDNTLTIVRGVLDLDHGKIMDNVLSLSLAELIKKKAEEKDTPEQAAAAPENEVEKECDRIAEKTARKAAKIAELRARKAKAAEDAKEAEKAVESKNTEKQVDDDFVNNHLPWEKDMKNGTGIEVEKTADGITVTAKVYDAIPQRRVVDVDADRKAVEELEAHKGGCFTDAPAVEINVDAEAEKRAIVADAAKVGLLQTEIEF